MRILLVSHLYPPRHNAGTERYGAELARHLVAAGHDVRVFCTDKDVSRRDLSLRERVHQGVRVHELTNNLYYKDFQETWRRPEVERIFARVCDEFAPDIVHFQHLMYLSAGCLEVAARRAAVVMTLHDFWLECPRMGQLVHVDGTICHAVESERCGGCLARTKWRQSATERRVGRWLAAVRSGTGLNLGPLARRLGRPRAARVEAQHAETLPVSAESEVSLASAARERTQRLRELARRCVDRFVSPSQFLAERMQRFGLDPDRVRVVPTGVDVEHLQGSKRWPRSAAEPLRVRFLGSLVPLKGAHVLLAAWGLLEPELRERAELRLHGPSESDPEYQLRLRQLAKRSGALLCGPLDREGVARTLVETDLLVVPSLWFENLPLVVLEAQATRTPLLVSDLGGLAEAVAEGVHGWCYPSGEVSALAERLRQILREPGRLDTLYPDPILPPTWESLAEAMERLYEEVRGQAREGAMRE